MSRPVLIGLGVTAMSHSDLRDAVLTNRRTRTAPSKPRVAHPEFLLVATGRACLRYRAVCDNVSLTGFATKLAAAHCAARDAWATRLGHGVSMAEIHLVDAGNDNYHAYLALGRVAG